MNTIEIRSKVDEILSSAQINFSARLVGATKRDDWECDAWRVKFGKWETDYFTGTGHRKPPMWPKPYPPLRPGTLAHEDYQRTFKPVAPKAADVLYSLILDSSAGEQSFMDWCADFGCSDDSLKALDTYRACCEISVKLRATFKPEVLNALRDAVQEL